MRIELEPIKYVHKIFRNSNERQWGRDNIQNKKADRFPKLP